MAFVFRSAKNLEEKIKPNDNLNFYENFNLLSEIYKKYTKKSNINKSQISFGSTSLRNSLNFKDGSDSPGPGSYRLQKSFLKSSFNQNVTNPNDLEGIEGEPAQLFISKEKRFKELKKSNQDNPSPGEYFKEKKIFEQNNLHQDLSHLKNFGVYYPFSKKRQISIPSDDFYYDVKNNGEIEVKQDLNKIKNIKNNLGPGSYNIKFYNKNNNSIDWSKTAQDNKAEKNKNKKNEEKNELKKLKINIDDTFSYSTLQNDTTYNEKNSNSTNLLTHNIERFADKICNTEILNQREKNKISNMYNLKKDDSPGPGEYNITFNKDAPVKFSNVTNFGSNSSRGLLYPLWKNKIRIGSKKKASLIIENNNKNNSKNNNSKSLTIGNYEDYENNKFNNSYRLHSQHVNDIKEKYIKNKNLFNSRLGPGTYNPSLSYDKNKKESYVQNFSSLEKRFLVNKDQIMFPGVGTYSTIDSYSPKKTYFQPIVPPNISQRHFIGISAPKIQEMKDILYYDKHSHPCVGEYNPEFINSIEYNMYKIMENNNDKKPCFNYAEKRFFEPKRKYEDQNQVGKYNLFEKEKEFMQKSIPFSSNVEKDGNKILIPKEKEDQTHLGPGTYRYDSYFDWNKKSYNTLFA